MTDQFPRGILREVSDAVDKLVPSRNTGLSSSTRAKLEQVREILLSSGDESPLSSDSKAVWLELIDLSLSGSTDHDRFRAVCEKLEQIPPLPGNAKAISINALRGGPR